MSQEASKENQKKSVFAYQLEYVPGYEPPFLERTLSSDAPGIQIMHIGHKVVVMPIERQPRDTSMTRSQVSRWSSHLQGPQQPGVFKLPYANQQSQVPEKDEDICIGWRNVASG
uniref:Uncharacterized protein n=1 Tax=Romanomermis culicivorax TaxID=13658 RepID=A0A915L285_ROMCU